MSDEIGKLRRRVRRLEVRVPAAFVILAVGHAIAAALAFAQCGAG